MITKHVIAWILVILVTFIFSPIWEDKEHAMQRVSSDITMIEDFFGNQQVAEVADRIYANSLLPVMVAAIKPFYWNKHEMEASGQETGIPMVKKYLSDLTGYFDTLMLSGYPFVLRGMTCFMIVMYSLPLFIGAALDGIMTQKIRSAMNYANPNAYHLSLHGIIISGAFPLLYAVAPWIQLPPNWFFVWAIFLIGSIRMAIANFPTSARNI